MAMVQHLHRFSGKDFRLSQGLMRHAPRLLTGLPPYRAVTNPAPENQFPDFRLGCVNDVEEHANQFL